MDMKSRFIEIMYALKRHLPPSLQKVFHRHLFRRHKRLLLVAGALVLLASRKSIPNELYNAFSMTLKHIFRLASSFMKISTTKRLFRLTLTIPSNFYQVPTSRTLINSPSDKIYEKMNLCFIKLRNLDNKNRNYTESNIASYITHSDLSHSKAHESDILSTQSSQIQDCSINLFRKDNIAKWQKESCKCKLKAFFLTFLMNKSSPFNFQSFTSYLFKTISTIISVLPIGRHYQEISILAQKVFLVGQIALPTLLCKETLSTCLLLLTLALRTFLSLWIASIHGSIVKTIVDVDVQKFFKNISILILYSFPASLINSLIPYLGSDLALMFRRRLSYYFLSRYMHANVFYHMITLDKRIIHPDQRLTDDIHKWSQALSALMSNMAKPILDIIFLSIRLSQNVGILGPLLVFLWYLLTSYITGLSAPKLGHLMAMTQIYEGDYRSDHTNLIEHSEEVAFFKGQSFEHNKLLNSFDTVWRHYRTIFYHKLLLGFFDNLLVKQGAVVVGYVVVILPIFTPSKNLLKYIINTKPNTQMIKSELTNSQATVNYVRNSSLLINLGKAVGRLIISLQDIHSLNGLTQLICQFHDTISDLQTGYYKQFDSKGQQILLCSKSKGTFFNSENISFEDIPIITPKGDTLVESLNVSIPVGSSLFIMGPNGSGKSSLFRILGELWPLHGGSIYKPENSQMFYIPQKPYFPKGTLREQIIYPDTNEMFFNKGYSDSRLALILSDISLSYLLNNRANNNFDIIINWNEQLSGGEKQKLALARVSYHRPRYAILDEATSAVSDDLEGFLYTYLLNEGITLITISHRLQLLKFHKFILKFENHSWSLKPI